MVADGILAKDGRGRSAAAAVMQHRLLACRQLGVCDTADACCFWNTAASEAVLFGTHVNLGQPQSETHINQSVLACRVNCGKGRVPPHLLTGMMCAPASAFSKVLLPARIRWAFSRLHINVSNCNSWQSCMYKGDKQGMYKEGMQVGICMYRSQYRSTVHEQSYHQIWPGQARPPKISAV